MPEPTQDIAHLLTDQQLAALEELAAKHGVSVEEVAVEAVTRYILDETGQNN